MKIPHTDKTMYKSIIQSQGLKYLLILCISLTAFSRIKAQENTLYFLDGVPDASYLNAARQPECNFFLTLPLVGGSFNYYNSAFTISDVIYPNASGDSLITPFHPDGDINTFLNLFDKTNVISGDYKGHIASLGFRVNRMYFTFNISLNANMRVGLPGDFINLALTGSENEKYYDISSFGVNSKMYIEYGIGISRQIMDNLSIGIRPKFYQGIYALNQDITNAQLYTSLDEWRIDMEGTANMALPYSNLPVDDEGKLENSNDIIGNEMDTLMDGFAGDPLGTFSKLFENTGFGIDIGIVYNPISKVELSAGVVDLGYINWKSHTHNFTGKGSYIFEGLNYNKYLSDDASDSAFSALTDSIMDDFNVLESNKAFRTGIEPSVYVGGRYYVSEEFDVGLLSRTKFYDDHIREDLTLSTNFRPSRAFQLSFSYSLIDASYSNFGIGASIRIGPGHLYVVTDDISLNRYRYPVDLPITPGISSDANSYNIRFGFMLMLGCNKEKKEMQDRPLLYSDESFIY